jgi:hypothetical protein
METTKCAIILLSLVLLVTGTAQSAEKSTAAEISNTRMASCLVKVTADPEVLPLSFETIEYLLYSSGVAGKTACDVLDIPADRGSALFEIAPCPEPVSEPPKLSRGRRPTLTKDYKEEYEKYEEMMMEMDEQGLMALPEVEYEGGRVREERSEQRSDRRSARTARFSRRPRVTPSASPAPTPIVERAIFFQLRVELPENVKPAAEEFIYALIDNLHQTLIMAYRDVEERLIRQLAVTNTQRKNAQSQLSNIMEQTKAIEPPLPIKQDPADMAVCEQLDQIVDLSMLSPEMPFSEAINILKNSADPPLKIVVLWRDLLDNAEIEPSNEINVDGLPEVRLGTALELLLKSVEDGFTTLDYVILNGVITIATKDSDSLPNNLVTRVYDISSLGHPAGGADNLIQLIRDTIEPDSWFEYGGECCINTYLGKKLAILQSPEVHRKIQEFLQATKIDIPTDIPMDTPVEALLEEKHNLLRDTRHLEMEVARLEARHSAIEEEIHKISHQITTTVEDDPVTRELQEIVDMHSKRYDEFEKLVSGRGRVSSPELESEMNKLVQAKIELAKRRGELSKSAGGDRLARFNDGLAEVMINLAEKRAQLDIADKQLKQTERQLIMATTFDPQVSQIRFAKQAFEVTDQRVSELKTRLDNLQPPTVTVIGGN